MSDSTPTPGPWTHEDAFARSPDNKVTRTVNRAVVASFKDPVVATVWANNIPVERGIANARLIASAPAMRQRLVLARRLLLQGNADAAMDEIDAGLEGVYDEQAGEVY